MNVIGGKTEATSSPMTKNSLKTVCRSVRIERSTNLADARQPGEYHAGMMANDLHMHFPAHYSLLGTGTPNMSVSDVLADPMYSHAEAAHGASPHAVRTS